MAPRLSIDWAQDEYVSRGNSSKFMVLTSAALVAGQFWIVLKERIRPEADTISERADRP